MNRTTKRELAERLTDDRSLYFRQLLRYSTKKLWNRLADQSMTGEQRQLSAERQWAEFQNGMTQRGVLRQDGTTGTMLPRVN